MNKKPKSHKGWTTFSKVIALICFTCLTFYSFTNIAGGLIFAFVAHKYSTPISGIRAGNLERYEANESSIFDRKLWLKEGVYLDGKDNMRAIGEYKQHDRKVGDDQKVTDFIHHTYIQSKRGVLSTYAIKTAYNPNSTKWMLLIHGISTDWTFSALTAQGYLKNGYNVMIYDAQGVDHDYVDTFGYKGSTGTYSSFGYWEQYDVHYEIKNLTKYVKTAFNDDVSSIGIYGMSMGAATLLMYLSRYGNQDMKDTMLKYTIVDSAYAHLEQEVTSVISGTYKVPSFLFYPGARVWYRLVNGYDPNEVNPIKNLNTVKVPTLIIQGTADKFVPYTLNFHQIYNSLTDLKGNKDNEIKPGDTKAAIQLYGATHVDHLEWNFSAAKNLNIDYSKGPFYAPMLLWCNTWSNT